MALYSDKIVAPETSNTHATAIQKLDNKGAELIQDLLF